MNTQTQLHELQAGEALPLPGSFGGRVILLEGEVLFQAPALYLAGTVVVPPVRRISAPARWMVPGTGAVRAASGARLLTEEAPSAVATLKAALGDLRRRYSVVMAPGGADAQRT